MNVFKLILNAILWYGFTIISVICSKKYLNLTNDENTLTFVTLAVPFVVKLVVKRKILNLSKNIKLNGYVGLAVFNIGTTLLTNIGMNQTTVSVTYMVKVINFF